MGYAIEIAHLTKDFGKLRALDDLSFRVEEGSLFAFLGENGAGKSTTIHILCGQLSKDRGTVRVGGMELEQEPERIRGTLGVVFQNSVLDGALTVRDNLMSRGALYGLTGQKLEARLQELSSLLEFEDLMKRTVGKLSGGQRRRIDIARALLHRPKLLILDEPTTGLDPQTRNLLWDVVARLRQQEGMTVFLTTHYMEEAAGADRVVILDRGRIAAEGTPRELKNAWTGDFVTLYGVGEEEAGPLGLPCEVLRDGIRLRVRDTAAATALILRHPELFRDYEITKGNMDHVFLAVTGKKLSGGEGK